MKYVATESETLVVPSSSTGYYRSERCRQGSTQSAVSVVAMDSEETGKLQSIDSPTLDKKLICDLDNSCRKMPSKPTQSYVMMIATAILQSSDQRMSLGSIYNWIEKQYPYFTENDATQGRWRNSVRHNLSLNDCFIKVGRCEDGKGNYWSIHPQNISDFKRGDFKQKQSRRRRGRKRDPTETYISLLTRSGQVIMDSKTGLPLYSPYSDEERKAYRLDEALIKRNVRAASLRFLSPAASDNYIPSSPQHPVTSPHLPWQHGASYFHNQQPDSPPYTPYTQSIQCNNTVYNSVGANVNYHHYYHHPPTHRPCAYGGSMTSPCQCCPSFQQFFPQI